MNLTPKRLIPLLALLATLVAAGCGSSSSSSGGSSGGGSQLALVAYSTPQEAYAKLIPAFQKTPAGKGVSFSQSFGASGDQERAIEGGQPADIGAFSLAPDADKLVKAGLVDKDWGAGPHQGFVTNSVVTFVVRKGNPKHIKTWADLIKPGVKVVIPNVFESGGAKWDIMAAYGQAGNDAAGKAYLNSLYKNVSVQPKSGRDALQTFTGGEGDVLVSYENEAITAQQKGQDVDYVTPDKTILIQNPVVLVKRDGKVNPKAQAFVKYLTTKPAQQIFADAGYRPVLAGIKGKYAFPKPAGLFTIDSLGGWTKLNKSFFDPDAGYVAQIFRQQGKSTGG